MIDAACPACSTSFRLPDTQAGKKVRCKSCQEMFTVPEELEELPVIEDVPSRSKKRLDEVEELPVVEEARPSGSFRPPRRPREDDREDRPRVRRRGRHEDDEDDYDDPPASGGGGMMMPLVIGGGLLLIVLVIGGVALAVAMSGPSTPPVADGGTKPPDPIIKPPDDLGKRDDGGKDADKGKENPPPPPPPPPKKEPPRNVAEALEALRDSDAGRKDEGMDFLVLAPAEPARAAEVGRALRPLLRDKATRARAARVAEAWPSDPAADELISLIDEGEPYNKAPLVRALGKQEGERALAALGRMLGDPFLRTEAAAQLKLIGKKAEKHALPLLHHKDYPTRQDVEKLLTAFGTDEALLRAQSIRSLSSTEERSRASAANWLAKHGPKDAEEQEEAAKALEGLLKDKERDVREAAAGAMKRWAVKANGPALVEVLEKGGVDDIASVIAAAARLKEERAIRGLMLRLNSKEREQIAEVLIGFGAKSEAYVWVQLNNTDVETRRTAVKILEKIGGEKSLKPLTALSRKDALTRVDVSVAVEQIKGRMKPK